LRRESSVTTVVYHIVQHDGGWAYRVNDSFSEPFPTRELAHRAAEAAASEQREPGETTEILYEDGDGHWHASLEDGRDRPETRVDD
jgi:hypothetical protein